MKAILGFTTAFLTLLASSAALAETYTYVGEPIMLHYFSPKQLRSLDVQGEFTATYTFDDVTKIGRGKLDLKYDLSLVGEGKKVEFKQIDLVCGPMDVNIPTVITKGSLVCMTTIPVIGENKFFTSHTSYTGTLPKNILHGSSMGHGKLIKRD